MSAAPGWYPDPGGRAGMFRYWDGRSWSAALSPHPTAAPPPSTNLSVPGRPAPGTPAQIIPPRRRPWGWLIGLGAVLIAVVVVVVLVLTRGGGGGVIADPSPNNGTPSTDVCPERKDGTPDPQPGDGRVHAGKLSYPELGSPWSAPEPEDRVAFGKGVLIQLVQTETNTKDGTPWSAAVLVGELVAGDGFFTPKDGAAIVVKCVSGTFYGNSEVTREDRRNEATQVGGHDAWIVESSLHFSIPGLEATSERLIVVIVDTGGGTAGLFYASIPENALQYLDPAKAALDGLTVDG